MNLVQITFTVFLAVAAGGLLLAILVARNARIPAVLSTGHGLAGLLAICGLFAVNLHMGDVTTSRSWWALGVLLSGFIGGLLFFRVIFKDRATLPLVFAHGGVAAIGLYLLFSVAF